METIISLFLPVVVTSFLLLVAYFVFEAILIVIGFIYDSLGRWL